jgi:hypothetical protein
MVFLLHFWRLPITISKRLLEIFYYNAGAKSSPAEPRKGTANAKEIGRKNEFFCFEKPF